jgi:hypothetical protein
MVRKLTRREFITIATVGVAAFALPATLINKNGEVDNIDPQEDDTLADKPYMPEANTAQVYISQSEAFRSVLLEDGELYNAAEARSQTLNQYLRDWDTYQSQYSDVRFQSVISVCTSVDLDGDDVSETILGISLGDNPNIAYYLVLTYQNGMIAGYQLSERILGDLNASGVFRSSSSADYNSFCRVYYKGEQQIDYEIVQIASTYIERNEDGSYVLDEDNSPIVAYFVNGSRATASEYLSVQHEYENSPSVIWYDYTHENITRLLLG